jgi:serine/threonine protein kinase
LIVSWVGSPDAGSYGMLPTAALEQARQIVLAMHERGVAHRDIRPLNMVYSFSTTKLYMIDFGQSETVDMIGKNYFDQACFEDLSELEHLIAISRSRRVRYYHFPKEWQSVCPTPGLFKPVYWYFFVLILS